MPSKNPKLAQQSSKAAPQTSTANTMANSVANSAKAADDDQNNATVDAPTNSNILMAIQSLREDFVKKICQYVGSNQWMPLKGDLLSHSKRIREAEEKILQTEEDVVALQEKVKQLERTVQTLSDKVQDQEDRGRRSNLRLVDLLEKTEGSDLCSFLENWLPKVLGDAFTSAPVIERAHRIDQVNPNHSLRPKTVIMKFLNYKDREITLNAARRIKEVRYGNQRVSFRQHQQRFNGVKAQP